MQVKLLYLFPLLYPYYSYYFISYDLLLGLNCFCDKYTQSIRGGFEISHRYWNMYDFYNYHWSVVEKREIYDRDELFVEYFES